MANRYPIRRSCKFCVRRRVCWRKLDTGHAAFHGWRKHAVRAFPVADMAARKRGIVGQLRAVSGCQGRPSGRDDAGPDTAQLQQLGSGTVSRRLRLNNLISVSFCAIICHNLIARPFFRAIQGSVRSREERFITLALLHLRNAKARRQTNVGANPAVLRLCKSEPGIC